MSWHSDDPPMSRRLLLRAVEDFVAGQVGTEQFCADFRNLYNVDNREQFLSEEEESILQRLFDEVVWFSPIPEDRDRYPGYRDEMRIASAASEAAEALRTRKP